MNTTRRKFLATTGTATVGTLLGVTGTGSAASDAMLEGRIRSHDGTPIPGAKVSTHYYDWSEEESYFDYVQLDDDGHFQKEIPEGQRVSLSFYKSTEDEHLAPRRDGVPHIYRLPPVTVPEGGYDLGDYRLPQAYTLDIRAVFTERPGGVEGAIPRFGSVRDRSYSASGYSYLTTDESGYAKFYGADFTGVEVAGDVRVWIYPPGYEPYEDQESANFAPYAEESVRNVEVTEDTTIEIDLSRRKSGRDGKGNGNGKGNGRGNGNE